jgi:peptide deformylase
MSVLPILTYPDPILKRASKPVQGPLDSLRRLAEDMVETMYAAPGVGLAAPQVGHALRLIVADVSNHQEGTDLIIMVNPEILWADGEILWEEGCLSVPDLVVEIPRSERLRVGGYDLSGNRVEIEAEGLLAIAFQHELDHLEGRLIVDRVSSLKRELYRRKRMRAAAQAEE